MAKVNHIKKVEKRVDKVVEVFERAIDEVNKTQLVLRK